MLVFGGGNGRRIFRPAPAVSAGGAAPNIYQDILGVSDAWGFWSAEEIAAATRCPVGAIRESWPLIYAALRDRGQASRASCAAAIATVAIETASTFKPVEEAYWVPQPARDAYYNDTTKHAPYSDGGVKYHGRGFIQTTHDYNYRRVGFEDNPDALLEPGPAAEAFGIYWQDHDIRAIADVGDLTGARQAVVGRVAIPPGLARLIQIVTDLGL